MSRWTGLALAQSVSLLCSLLLLPSHYIGLIFYACAGSSTGKDEILWVQCILSIRIQPDWVSP